MKYRIGIILMLAFCMIGCAKKPTMRPDRGMSETAEASAEEPEIRFSDWRQVPELKAIQFEYDKAQLLPEAREILKKNAEFLKNHTEVNILVEGHCDERGTIEYNLGLGQRRAAAVRAYYGTLGVAVSRIGTISYGEEKPLDPGHTETAWYKNRRVETKVRSTANTGHNEGSSVEE